MLGDLWGDELEVAGYLPGIPVVINYPVASFNVCDCGIQGSSEEAHLVQVPRYRDMFEGMEVYGPPRNMNALSVRKAFEAIKDAEDARALFEIAGPFRAFRDDRPYLDVPLSEVFEWQRYLDRIKLDISYGQIHGTPGPRDAFKDYGFLRGWIDWQIIEYHSQFPDRVIGMIGCRSILEAIVATIRLDHVQRVRYRACQNCNRVFKVGKRPAQRFCNEECGHAAGERRRREDRAKRDGKQPRRSARGGKQA